MAKVKLGDIQIGEDGQDWRVWQAGLETGKAPKRDTEVTTGYWRIESGKLYATPVASYFKDGEIQVDFPTTAPFLPDYPEDVIPAYGDMWHKFASEFWPKCKPVSYEAYEKAVAEGRWEDGQATQKRDAIGGNNSPEDEAEKMLREARENLAKAKKMVEAGAAGTQKAADAAAILEKAMSTQRAALDELRKQEKEPHLRASQAVDEKFNPLIKDMQNVGRDLAKKVKDPYLQKQEQIRAEAAAAAQRIIDEQRAAEEAAEAAKNPKPATPLDEGWEEAQPAAVQVVASKVTAGAKGARSSLRDVRYGVITDHLVMVTAMVKNLRFHIELENLLITTATRMARGQAGQEAKDGDEIYPGVKLEIRRES